MNRKQKTVKNKNKDYWNQIKQTIQQLQITHKSFLTQIVNYQFLCRKNINHQINEIIKNDIIIYIFYKDLLIIYIK